MSPSAQTLYLDLLKMSLTRGLVEEDVLVPLTAARASFKRKLFAPVEALLRRRGLVLARAIPAEEVFQESPPPIRSAETLIGPVGLENLERLIEDILRSDTPGDLIETGVWRGGAVIFMRGVLEAHGDETRSVWAADSFAGLPSRGDTRYPEDEADIDWTEETWLSVSLDEVKRNIERYGLLDDRVRFLPGWFHETLVDAPIDKIALMRLDGDMYGSTMDALQHLYPKLSKGGYVVIDDYWLPKCRAAVDDFRQAHGISDTIVPVDRAIVYWQRTG